jgi:hypothetical protein
MRLIVSTVLLSCCFGFPASAGTISLTPVSQITNGSPVSVDVLVSGLDVATTVIGSFGATVQFDPALLAPAAVDFGPGLGDPDLLEALTDFSFLEGAIEFAQVSLLSESSLFLLQSSEFRLATLTFQPIGLGTTPLRFSNVLIDDSDGIKLPFTEEGGSITIVPEPGTVLVIGLLLLVLLCISRRKRLPTIR